MAKEQNDGAQNQDEVFREFSSPPCYAYEIDPAYNGMMEQADLLALLEELLEGERAGTRVTKETLQDLKGTSDERLLSPLVERIQADEKSYCRMLMDQIRAAGGEPGNATGAFYDKCMAIADIRERLNFLNRGQNWVVRKIDEVTPKIVDRGLLNALVEMRDTHEANVSETSALLESL